MDKQCVYWRILMNEYVTIATGVRMSVIVKHKN